MRSPPRTSGTTTSDRESASLATCPPDDELIAVEEIEADPIHLRQGVIHQGGQIGRIGGPVGLPADQRGGLIDEPPVLFDAVLGERFGVSGPVREGMAGS